MMNDEANAAKKGEIIIIFDDDLDGTSGEDSVEFDEILETLNDGDLSLSDLTDEALEILQKNERKGNRWMNRRVVEVMNEREVLYENARLEAEEGSSTSQENEVAEEVDSIEQMFQNYCFGPVPDDFDDLESGGFYTNRLDELE